MQKKIEDIVAKAKKVFEDVTSYEELEVLFKDLLGKNGELSEILKGIKDLSDEDKKSVGPLANGAKLKIEEYFHLKKSALKSAEIATRIQNEILDISLPGKWQPQFDMKGAHNPFALFMDKSINIFSRLGFEVWDGSHIVSDFDCFESLNFKADHPARDMQDTFYVEDGYLLRTHTSALQNKILSTKEFPIRAIAPGKCFRNEATDSTHEVIFSQLEGVVVDEHITVSHLIGTLKYFLKEIFGKEIRSRIRPGYFPFVEPGLELEIDKNELMGIESNTPKWMEVMPCGMIHPKVLEKAGIDPKKYSGFAFGFGIDRLAMMTYGISDVRMMFSDDKKFLLQFQE